MKLFERPRLRWREPRAFLRQRDDLERRATAWWVQPVILLVLALFFMAQWWLARFDPRKEPPSFENMLIIVLLGSALLVYGLPPLVRLCPSEVRLQSDLLMRSQGNGHLVVKYADIHGFEWLGTPEYHVLLIQHGKNRRVASIGLPLDMDPAVVTRMLLEKHIPQGAKSL